MYYSRQGNIPTKAFTVHCGPTGEPTHEEMVTSAGFSGPASLLYHLRAATVVGDISLVDERPLLELAGGSLRNHHVAAERLSSSGSFSMARTPVFYNEDLTYWLCSPTEADDSFCRNALCDELVLVVRGSGRLGSVFGTLEYAPLDFIRIPRGITVRLEEITGDQLMIVMETAAPIEPPRQYVNQNGQLSFRGLYQERDIRIPEFRPPNDVVGDHTVLVRAGDKLVRHTVGSHPFDVVGWDGALYPYAVSMESFAPMSAHVHTTPDIYQVFQSHGVYVNAITPVRQPDHDNSTTAQPDHSSDCDEIFHRFGRPDDGGFGAGSITLHSRIAPHGAAPALKSRPRRERTTGWGILIDTVRPARMAVDAEAADLAGYHGEAH
jgi:homogentisate 1,2-dioxygenase